MQPYFNILGKQIPTYGIMTVIGLVFGIVYIYLMVRKNSMYHKYIEEICVYSAIGIFIGAKLLYILTVLPQIIDDINTNNSFTMILNKYFASGFVFYGGLYGFIIAVFIYCKIEKLEFIKTISLILPAFTITHAFGRIGCFLVGCCYGIESETFGIAFKNSIVAPNNIPLIPVQLIESTFVFMLSFLLIILIAKKCNYIVVIATYIYSYSIFRFIIEFYRGDTYRTFIGTLSISQFLSIINLLVLTIILIINKRTLSKT